MKTSINISLKEYNTFGIDVCADKFIEVYSEDELLRLLKEENSGLFILGGGSNILFSGNYRGTVMKLSYSSIEIMDETGTDVLIQASAGVVWDDLVAFAVKEKYSGIENLSLIPGSVGAAPIQNIGAYGQELSNVLHSVEGYLTQELKKVSYNKEQCEFGYRDSIFKNDLKNRFIITAVTLKLEKIFRPDPSYSSVKEVLQKKMIEVPSLDEMRRTIIEIRRSKLPDPEVFGNAGSFFKNPEVPDQTYEKLLSQYPGLKGYPVSGIVKLYAGQLIEICGWKGVREGNTGSHSDQALVIINYGGATGKEIIDFSRKIKKSVYDTFGIELQEEINIL